MALSRNDQLSRVWSYLDSRTRKAYNEGEISDDDLLRVGLQQGWIEADFSEVSGESSTVPVQPGILETLAPVYNEPREAAANMGQALRGGGKRSAGAQLFSAEDQGAELPAEFIRSLVEMGDFTGGGVPGDLLRQISDLATGQQTRETNEQLGRRLFEEGTQQIKVARDDSGNMLTRGLVDVGSSPSSFVSLIGGPAAGIGGADVFAQEYTQARLEGLPEEEARARATGQASAETLLSVIPSGKLLGLGGDAAKRFLSDRARWAARTGATSIGEGLQEGATTLAQLGLDKLTSATADSKELRDYANAQLPADVTKLWEMTRDSIVAGAIGGGGIGGGMATVQVAAERGKLAGDLLNTLNPTVQDQELRKELRALTEQLEAAPQTTEIFPENPAQQEVPDRQAQEDAAWEQRRLERAREDNSDAMRTSLQRRVDTAQDQVFELEEAIAEGDRSQSTLREATAAQRRLEEAQTRLTSFESQRAAVRPEPAPAPAPVVEPAQDGIPTEAPAPTVTAPEAPAPAPVAAPVVKRPRKKKTATEKQADVKDTRAFLEDVAKGLRSNRTGNSTGVTVRNVRDAIVNKLGSGDANVAARVLTNGNVKLVSDSSMIRTQEMQPVGTAGFYDGNTTYVVADMLEADNIIGEFLTVAAHELKHGGDLSADPTLRTKLGEVIGEEANSKLIPRIEAAARQGNETAQKAVAKAKESENYELELPAYLFQFARDARNEQPAIRRIMGDVTSAVRTRVKKFAPGDYEVNLDDVAYLSDQLLKETAISNPSLAADPSQPAPNLQMIVRGDAGQADSYLSKDTNIKRWMSDADSSIRADGATLNDILLNYERSGSTAVPTTTTLGKVLDHDTLFSEYPELRDYKVTFVDNLEGGAHGSFNPGTKEIKILTSIAQEGLGYDSDLHRLMLHEVQHAVQSIEGFDGGTNPDHILTTLRSSSQKAKLDSLSNTVSSLAIVANSDSGNPARFLSVTYKVPTRIAEDVVELARQRTSELQQQGTPQLKALEQTGSDMLMWLEALSGNTASDRLAADLKAMEQLRDLRRQDDKLKDQATIQYFNNQGESEARFTQFNIPVRNLHTTGVRHARAKMNEPSTRFVYGQADEGKNPERIFGPDVWSDTADSGTVITPTSPAGLASSAIPPRTVKVGEDPKALNEVIRGVNRLLVPGQGFGPVLGEITQHAKSFPASLAVRGAQHTYELMNAIKVSAKRTGKTQEDIHAELGKRMDAIDGLDNREARRSAVAAIDRDFPGVGKAMNAMRDYKLSLARELLALRLRDPKPLTQKEVAIYTKMKNNAERYTTRAYLATYDKELGLAYGKHLMKAFNADPTSKEGKVIQGAIDYLKNNELMIPEREGLEALKVKDIRRIYETWIGSSSRLKGSKGKQKMIDELSNLPPKTTEQINKKSVEVVKDMLGLNKNKGSRLFVTPGVRQNRTILEARTDLPDPLRALLGEITDPVLRETVSLQRMMNLVTKTKTLTEIFEQGESRGWWSDERTDAHQRQLNNPSYGPLDGKWINQDVEDAITGTILSLDNIDTSLADLVKEPDVIMKIAMGAVFKPSHRIMAIQKTWQVVANPFNMLANFVGALALMAPSQGIINPVTYWRGMNDTRMVLGREIDVGATSEARLAAIEELLFAGVTDSATMGEFRSEAYKTVHDQISKMIENKTYTPVKALKVLGKELIADGDIANGLRQVYAFMDVWVKASTYYDRKNFWTEMNKLETMGMTDEQIMRKSGYEASGTNVSYERASPIVRALERNVPFFMFLTYFSETFRATAMSYAQVAADLSTASKAQSPKAKALALKMATTRLIGTTAATFGVQQMVMAALDSEDEEEKKKRQLDPEYMADKWTVPMGLDADGNEVMFNVQRADPIGPHNELMIAMHLADPDERINALSKAVSDMFVESHGFLALAQVPWDATIEALSDAIDDPAIKEWDANRQRNTIMERNYPEAYNWLRETLSAGDIGENTVTAIEKLFLPSGVAAAVDAERTQVSEVREDDLRINGKSPAPALRAAGYKAYVRDPDTSLTFRVFDYENEMSRLRKERNDLNARAEYLDAADLIDNLLTLRDQEEQAFLNLSDAMEGYLAFDSTKYSGAMEIVGNKKLSGQLRNRRFESTLLDGDALKRWYDQAKKEKGVDKEELRQKYRLLQEMYKETN